MDAFQAAFLGAVQGLTEFLPVSSSGHLVIMQHLFGLKEPMLLFDVTLHVGTLSAVFILLRREILAMLKELIRLPDLFQSAARNQALGRPGFRMMLLIVAGSAPTGLIGLLFKDFFESLFASTLAVGFALLGTGTILFAAGRARPEGRTLDRFRFTDALVIGFTQGLAIIPGLSRSGTTIGTGLLLGIERDLAARFSFLLSIPAILGALFLELRHAPFEGLDPLPFAAGFLASLIVGLLALAWLLRLVKQGRLTWFSYYCWTLGAVTVGYHWIR